MQKIPTVATINRDPAAAEINTVRNTESVTIIINVSEYVSIIYNKRQRSTQGINCYCTCTCVTELSDVQMCGLVADGIVEHTAVGVVILIFHLQM